MCFRTHNHTRHANIARAEFNFENISFRELPDQRVRNEEKRLNF